MKEIETFDYNSIKSTIDNMPEDRKEMCTSLLNELLFMQETLEELKINVKDNGVITSMCQGKYSIDRANPALMQYNTLMKNYSGCIKQLNELLPKVEISNEDEFDDDEL